MCTFEPSAHTQATKSYESKEILNMCLLINEYTMFACLLKSLATHSVEWIFHTVHSVAATRPRIYVCYLLKVAGVT